MFRNFINNTAIARTLANRDGIAAIEFALIAPVMIALYIGLAEVSLLVTADRNVSHAASVTADLATQIEVLDEGEIENIFQATIAVMSTNFTQSQAISVDMTSFEVIDDVKTVVGWAEMGDAFAAPFDATNVNATLLNDKSGLVVTRISYDYKSPSREFVKTPTLSETFMLKPRKSATVPFENAAGNDHALSCSISESNSKIIVDCS